MPQPRKQRVRQICTLRSLVEGVCRRFETRLVAQSVQLVVDVPAELAVRVDADLLGRAVRNLVENALDAMPRGGSLVATSAVGVGGVELEIADTGWPLSDEELHEAFELNPTALRKGTRWGLAVVRRIAELHGGDVTAANCPEGGAAFTLRIPGRFAREAAA